MKAFQFLALFYLPLRSSVCRSATNSTLNPGVGTQEHQALPCWRFMGSYCESCTCGNRRYNCTGQWTRGNLAPLGNVINSIVNERV